MRLGSLRFRVHDQGLGLMVQGLGVYGSVTGIGFFELKICASEVRGLQLGRSRIEGFGGLRSGLQAFWVCLRVYMLQRRPCCCLGNCDLREIPRDFFD